MKLKIFILSLAALLLASCGQKREPVDLSRRAVVDSYNKEAFLNRYNNPATTIECSRKALDYMADSLPQYLDGRLRAWNNMAIAYYMASMPDSAAVYIDSVGSHEEKDGNWAVEHLISQLTLARIYQRNCQIADSYQLLYDIGKSDVLEQNRDNILYNYAQSEYYITMLTLNYHYRNGMEENVEALLSEAEEVRSDLKCDYAQDMALNYALAYGYASLCAQDSNQAENLARALSYCADNLELMADTDHESLFHLANTVQMFAFLYGAANISDSVWAENGDMVDYLCELIRQNGVDVYNDNLLGTVLFVESTHLFEVYGDPYQTLGAYIATGNYFMQEGDTLAAQSWFRYAYEENLMPPHSAPKFESYLFEGLIVSGAAYTPEENAMWFEQELDILNYIKQNEKEDFILRTRFSMAKNIIVDISIFAASILLALILVLVPSVLLVRRTRALRREKKELQEAKQKDVERIANVETCLSVMRHDINPFISYLQNKNLPEELRNEVLDQLLRTFENIKNWTNLSIPSGLQFVSSSFALQKAFDEVSCHTVNHHPDKVELRIVPTDLCVQADYLLLVMLLRNLLSNAMKHTAAGRVSVEAKVCEEDERFVQVDVADTGCGMSAEEVENLFRADKKPHTEESSQGNGFGLILCRYIIKKHDDNTLRGCRIWAESTPEPAENHGTVFHFLIKKSDN